MICGRNIITMQQSRTDSLALIKAVLDKLSLNHASPQHVVDTATKLVHELEQFYHHKKSL